MCIKARTITPGSHVYNGLRTVMMGANPDVARIIAMVFTFKMALTHLDIEPRQL